MFTLSWSPVLAALFGNKINVLKSNKCLQHCNVFFSCLFLFHICCNLQLTILDNGFARCAETISLITNWLWSSNKKSWSGKISSSKAHLLVSRTMKFSTNFHNFNNFKILWSFSVLFWHKFSFQLLMRLIVVEKRIRN